eukprot:31534-Ditylum_brightwellii.AAC.1
MTKKNSYKRVYRNDNTYHYPQILENLLCEKGKDYFTNLELTGSSKGIAKSPSISLLKEYQTNILPEVERKVVQRFSEGGTKKVIIVKQEDNAGLHQDQTYVDTMKDEFDQREWLLFNQASNSLDCITQDACTFPVMSKQVSSQQALQFGCQMMKDEELYQTVKKDFDNEKNSPLIARVFAARPQIACAIIENKG